MQDERRPGPRPAGRGTAARTGKPMNRDRRFGKRTAEPSSVQIVHELKLMALRQSLDDAVKREAADMPPSADGTAVTRDIIMSPSDPARGLE